MSSKLLNRHICANFFLLISMNLDGLIWICETNNLFVDLGVDLDKFVSTSVVALL